MVLVGYWRHYPGLGPRSAIVLAARSDHRKVFEPLPQREQSHPRMKIVLVQGNHVDEY